MQDRKQSFEPKQNRWNQNNSQYGQQGQQHWKSGERGRDDRDDYERKAYDRNRDYSDSMNDYGNRDNSNRSYNDRSFRNNTYGRNNYGQSNYREMNEAPSQYGVSNFNRHQARQDAEQAFSFGGGRDNRWSSRDENYRENFFNPIYGSNERNADYQDAYTAPYMSSFSNRRNRDISQYANNDFDSTRYGESELYSRTSENNRDSKVFVSHFGKGPKNYKRSDSRIQEDAQEALKNDHEIDASEIEVSVKDGVVSLSGSVAERKMKRLAEDCVEKVSGVLDVRNEISTSSFLGGLFKSDKSEGKTQSSPRGTKSSPNPDMM